MTFPWPVEIPTKAQEAGSLPLSRDHCFVASFFQSAPFWERPWPQLPVLAWIAFPSKGALQVRPLGTCGKSLPRKALQEKTSLTESPASARLKSALTSASYLGPPPIIVSFQLRRRFSFLLPQTGGIGKRARIRIFASASILTKLSMSGPFLFLPVEGSRKKNRSPELERRIISVVDEVGPQEVQC